MQDTNDNVTGGLRSLAQILEDAGERESLPVTDTRNPYGYEIDREWITLWWGGYEYNIASARIDTPEKALGWLHHVCEKTWSGTTPERIANLISSLASRNGWTIHGM